MIRLLVGLLLALAPAAGHAAEPLQLAEVLSASARHAPQIIEAMMRERQAAGRLTAATGAFDTVFETDLQVRPLGYYGGAVGEAKLATPMAQNGGSIYAGYRLSSGAFPSYDGGAYTNRFGEAKVGAVFALMRGRLIDDRRARVSIAETDVKIAELDREMVAIGVQRRAIDAYQQWAAAGMRVAVYRDLLQLADARQESIERQIALGARPELLAVENRQNIVRRRALLVRAEQELAQAANNLSFYYRDASGAPVTPTSDRLPPTFPTFVVPDKGENLARSLDRPDLESLLMRLAQAEVRMALARNDLAPRLDLRAELSKDLGPAGFAGNSRTPAEAFVGLKLTVPLQRREARGRFAEARAEADGVRARRRLVEDQIVTEINSIAIQVDAAKSLVGLAKDEAALTSRMADAERRRFALGASDFILVNLREEQAADARLRQLDTEFRLSAARAELVAATVDRKQLGLQPQG
jgi:outer membrane protein TolC